MATYWKDHRYASSHRLATVELRGRAEPQSLFAIALPTRHGSSEEQDFDGIAGREGRCHLAILCVHAGLWSGAGRREQCGWLVRTIYSAGHVRSSWELGFGKVACWSG